MNEHVDDVICQVRESFSGLRMDLAVEEVFARSRARRRRRLSVLTAAGAAATGATVALTLALGGPAAPARSARLPAASPSPSLARLAAFTVTSGPGDSTTIVLRKDEQLDSAALREALAQHGIPALVTVGTFCRSTPSAAIGSGLITSPSSQAGGSAAVVIDGSAIAPGTQLSIGYGANWIKIGVITDGAPLTCTNPLAQPAAHVVPSGNAVRRAG
jgi:hypothetical protein